MALGSPDPATAEGTLASFFGRGTTSSLGSGYTSVSVPCMSVATDPLVRKSHSDLSALGAESSSVQFFNSPIRIFLLRVGDISDSLGRPTFFIGSYETMSYRSNKREVGDDVGRSGIVWQGRDKDGCAASLAHDQCCMRYNLLDSLRSWLLYFCSG